MCCTKHYCSFEILTILGQCFQHIEQVHRDLPLCGPSGTHPQGKVQDAAAHQILPYLDICKGFHLVALNRAVSRAVKLLRGEETKVI